MGGPTILLVDDEPSMLRYTKTLLEVNNYSIETASNGEEMLQRMQSGSVPSLILLDVAMPGMDGLEVLQACKQIRPEQKIVMLSCINDTNKVVQAIKLGASDYITKPFENSQLQGAIRRALEADSTGMAKASRYAVKDAEVVEDLEDNLFFLAASPVMKQIRAQVALVAKVDVPVLLLGESGVGKEILARLIHKMSIRAHRPMLKVNCAALPSELLESELFGYEAGAFTGAIKAKPGKFELCQKGTILLDEIGEMSVPLQAKLLQVLQDGQFSRLGGRGNITVNVRVLAATNIDIQAAIANNTFRRDLYYRLNAFTMTIPPLRERREEIPILLKHFLYRLSEAFGKLPPTLSNTLIDECIRYPWPGNLRELGNFVKRLLVLGDESAAVEELRMNGNGSHDIGTDLSMATGSANGDLKAMVRNLKEDAECKEILKALQSANWNRKVAAASLKISYKAMLYKIKQHQLHPPAAGARILRPW